MATLTIPGGFYQPPYLPLTSTGFVADSGNDSHFGKLVGIGLPSSTKNLVTEIVTQGDVTNPVWHWITGKAIYVNGAGFSHTAPTSGWIQKVGLAKSNNTIYVQLGEATRIVKTSETVQSSTPEKGDKGDKGDDGTDGASAGSLTITATDSIPAFGVVTSQGKLANSGNVSQGFGKIVGVAPSAIASGFSGEVMESGAVTNPSWTFTAGDVIYLNGTTLSASAPSSGFVQKIGTAISPTQIVVELGEPVML